MRMHRLTLAALLTLLLPVSVLAASIPPPLVFLHMRDWQVHAWSYLATNAQICGAQIVSAWRSVDHGAGVYDWSPIEASIAPWASAGKKVGLTFSGVDAIYSQEGDSNTTVLATPDYVMAQTDHIECGAITVTDSTGTVFVKNTPPTPVYWEPGYANNWKKFIRAAIRRYQDDPRVAYMRFGTGAAGESFPITQLSQSATCTALLNGTGMSYATWLNYTQGIVNYVGSLHPRVPIFWGLNTLPTYEPNRFDFARALSATAVSHGFVVGIADAQNPAWDPMYAAFQVAGDHTYMQTSSLEGDGALPWILQNGQSESVRVWELYPRQYVPSAYATPAIAAEGAAALASLGTPSSCDVLGPQKQRQRLR